VEIICAGILWPAEGCEEGHVVRALEKEGSLAHHLIREVRRGQNMQGLDGSF
jgi:hypothetical protein